MNRLSILLSVIFVVLTLQSARAQDVGRDGKTCPKIISVNYTREENSGFDSYNVICDVQYTGSKYLYVSVEEEFSSLSRSQFVYQENNAHFVCKDISSSCYAWIDITAENDYGQDTYSIELPPLKEPTPEGDIYPILKRAKVLHTERCEDNQLYYDATVRVWYKNSNYIQAYVEQENYPYLTSYFSNESDSTTFYLKRINSSERASLKLVARNDNGSDEMILELNAPGFLTNIRTSCSKSNVRIKAYNLMGVYLGDYTSEEDLPQHSNMILCYYKNGLCVKRIKRVSVGNK